MADGPGLVALAVQLHAALVAFDPAAASESECSAVVEILARVGKACATARARAAARAGMGRDRLARVSGTTVSEAREALSTLRVVDDYPATRDALVAGEVSLAQAAEVVRTADECGGGEADMLALARVSTLGVVRDEGRRRRLAALSPEELDKRQHRAREFRWWRGAGGMVHLSGALPPVMGVALMNRLDAETDRARRDGGWEEPRAAYAADALVRMLAGGGRPRNLRADVVVVCDLRAWRRGRAEEGEPCHVVGGGPVPVDVVRAMVDDDAFVKAVVHDGVRIDTVAHLGRHIPAELRTALDLGSVPGFEGATCADEDCDRRFGLQVDHDDPVANGGLTSLDNLKLRCAEDHREKTERDRQAGLLGPGLPP
ncbi:MAG: HNH endonuclease [Acidimicrobiales bacterium]